ncbi:Short-chain dehydrogenase/reductase SDR [Macrophomina phaseolina MS6]|uniref:Short-chain dehydrogenase/reductase SDR n=2 Tax=Macrophomina phaseolina TaxID=35725 RepID=K2S0T0_MACPH|nr:Short-chain dehydrogenase/reductase SDR [Macrophomina phaseolina MS6]KAH7053057.1 short-chain dehydrogenase/oxidoreductase [Macrophomina phaseolina]
MGFGYKKVLLVGATSGIGAGLADKLVQEGVHVVAVGRRKENLDAFVSKHGSDKASAFPFDITDLKAIPKFYDDVTTAHPDIDSVFLNSGIQRGMNFTKPEKIDLDTFDLELNTNYSSFVHLTKYFLAFLQKQSNPTSIIYTTSNLALAPISFCPNYCASKAALHHFILVLREQMKAGGFSNLKVVEVFPPAVQTELHDADKQPYIEHGRRIGMPLADFISETWDGLSSGKEQIPVGMSKISFEGWEQERQKAFLTANQQMDGMLQKFYAY